MTNGWPMVPLGEIAIPIARTVKVEPGREYRTIGVKWWGEGAYERETIDGSRTAAKTLSLVRKDDLIINKIWVRHGSTAIATEAVDGCAASGEFPTFQLKRDRVEPRWLHWQTRVSPFWEKCDGLSHGTSGKNRIKPELFLTIAIPLPPIEEQVRIVARIEALAAKITKAQNLHEESKKSAASVHGATIEAVLRRLAGVFPVVRLADCTELITDGDHFTPSFSDAGVKFIFVGNVSSATLHFSGSKFVTPEYFASLSHSLDGGHGIYSFRV